MAKVMVSAKRFNCLMVLMQLVKTVNQINGTFKPHTLFQV